MTANDVHYNKPSARFKITRVGVKGVRKPICVHRHGKTVMLTATIDLYVDLPATQKGSHMSRNVELLDDAVDRAFGKPGAGIEEMASALARALLERHEYASRAEARISAEYFMDRKAPSGRKTTEVYGLKAAAVGERSGQRPKVKKSIGVEVTGMTTCPCAMEGVRELVGAEGRGPPDSAGRMPAVTHNQRNVTSLEMDVPDGFDVEAEELIDIVENALSSPTREILKRGDEAALVLAAHRNPKFVEDVVRGVLGQVIERFNELPGDVQLSVRSVSRESIHKHDALAERVTTLGELRG